MFEKYDYDRLEELEDRAEKGIIDKHMRPYLKWLTSRSEQIQSDRERLNKEA